MASELQVTHLLIIPVNTSSSTRLRERERKSRDWSKHDRSYPATSIQRHWSAESYKGKNVASSRKPSSPQHFSHLKNRPASACSRPKLQISERVLQHIIHESRYVIHEDISDFIEEIVLGVFYSQVGRVLYLKCTLFKLCSVAYALRT
ncbi:hypothetical protein P5673_009329 [Acropora cervicornis]|uniref:Uncharacterized protein n=1 Tax=Acropora cervicornis TaxID=6130 RepID=A0AAD9QSP0_ACRCE|nr:hypothetical protein P5673_009329 [Acropora cervicornis]